MVSILKKPEYLRTNFERVHEFMKVFGQEVKEKPAWPSWETMDLRIDLIEEELKELKDTIISGDGTLVEVADFVDHVQLGRELFLHLLPLLPASAVIIGKSITKV